MTDIAPDPFPVGTLVVITDYDGTTIDATFKVVRSYWPAASCELVTDNPRWPGLNRNRHERLTVQASP